MKTSYHKIHESTDYSKFKVIENRKVYDGHVKLLVQSIQRENRLHLHPIIVSPNEFGGWDIADGQHRFVACRILKIPVQFMIIDEISEYSVIDDQIAKRWILEDYLMFYSKKGYTEYLKIKKIMDQYNIPFKVIYYLQGTGRILLADTFKKGKCVLHSNVVKFLEDTHETFKEICDLYSFANEVFFRRSFLEALLWAHKKHNRSFQTLCKNMKKKFSIIPQKATRLDYEIIFCRLINAKHPRNPKARKIEDDEN